MSSRQVPRRALLPPPEPHLYEGIDRSSTLMIAQLALEDIDAVNQTRRPARRASGPSNQFNRANKPPPLSDEELAFRLQAEEMQAVSRTTHDNIYAKSIGEAMDRDREILVDLMVKEQAAEDDRNAALALHRAGVLPPMSAAQRSVGENGRRAIEDVGNMVQPPLYRPGQPLRPAIQAELQRAVVRGPYAPLAGSPFAARRAAPPVERVECVICGDGQRISNTLKAPCDHYYCRTCLVQLVEAATRDETLFPPRCCQRPIPIPSILPLLSAAISSLFQKKSLEFGVPSLNRVYCPNPTCSTFLGSTTSGQALTCHKCLLSVCRKCKQRAHPLTVCRESRDLQAVRALAQTEGWQTCPGCNSIVELHVGCYHMTCRCGYQFCYVCAIQWKNCGCPQWDENRLLETAQRRVAAELGPQVQAQAPREFARRVQERTDNLRVSHNCAQHRWRKRNEAGRCEECHNYLREFLLVCSNCYLAACVRCSRNRL
ncbi:hypothetical protein BDN72DRAFT_845698 [Pluteus cervinus]|uniref:Uncharacterized protein n=1 Tax=Pluteus cervinus TaxID=181527 RepID=A0ACD3AIG3_9AGAR|nr:hypothetical protein BDN72DRAFT_845698 [Pluteus cervinus]